MFGVGADAGQTTIRLRHAYGQWGKFGGGQLESPFMDLDVFPNILDYWGPNGMVFFRNAQVFWEPIDTARRTCAFALERPGRERRRRHLRRPHRAPERQAAVPAARTCPPDYKYGTKWGYVKLAGIVRDIHWDADPDRHVRSQRPRHRMGRNLSSNIKFASKPTSSGCRSRTAKAFRTTSTTRRSTSGAESKLHQQPHAAHAARRSRSLGLSAYLDHCWNPSVTRPRSGGRWSTSPTAMRSSRTRSTTASTPAESPLDAREQRSDGRRAPVRRPGEFRRRLPLRRLSHCSSRSSTASRRYSEENHDHRSFSRQCRAAVTRGATVARIAFIASIAAASAAGSQAATEPSAADIQRALNAAYTKYKDLHEGKNADYIPALAKVDPNLFGIALVTPDGRVYTAGDTTTQVSIQSISKVFTLARVLQDSGEKADPRQHRRRCHGRRLQLDRRDRARARATR